MNKIYIKNGNVILKDRVSGNSAVLIESGRIARIGKISRPQRNRLVINAKNLFVAPGLIDSHIHGSARDVFANELKFGTTSIVATLSCGSISSLAKASAAVGKFMRTSPYGRNVLGLRIEGPYISKLKAGSQNKRFIKKPDAQELLQLVRECGPILKMVTIAPELEGTGKLIKILRRRNIIASMGHSNATYKESARGIDKGLRHATHIFNGMRQIDRHEAGIALAALLDDRVSVEVIADLAHVHSALINLLVEIKKIDNIILITDSVRSGSTRGMHKTGNVYKLKNGKIAGSSLRMIEALRNVVKIGALDLVGAVKAASTNPARVFGFGRRKGLLAPGMDADLVIFDKNFKVACTIMNGNIIYRRKGLQICAE